MLTRKRIYALLALLMMVTAVAGAEPFATAGEITGEHHLNYGLQQQIDNLRPGVNIMGILLTMPKVRRPLTMMRNNCISGGTLVAFGSVPVYAHSSNQRRNAMYVSFGIVYINPPAIGGYSRPSIGPCCALHF